MSSSVMRTVKAMAATVVLPYLLGFLLSPTLIEEDHFHRFLETKTPAPESLVPSDIPDSDDLMDTTIEADEECDSQFKKLVAKTDFEGINLVLHHNGVADSCGTIQSDWDALRRAVHTFDACPNDFDKYDAESLLTRLFAASLSDDSCGPDDLDEPLATNILGFCDRGEEFTPILTDYGRLVRHPVRGTLPCRFHTREGLRIASLDQLVKMIQKAKESSTCAEGSTEDGTCAALPEVHLYAVPAGRVFMLAPKFIGEIFHLDHVQGADGHPISLKVMSLSPRVFDIFNFFSKNESKDLVQRALAETSETHRIKRSSTGAEGYNIFKKRTSESGFDTHGTTAIKVKKRCFKVLGFDEYIEGHGDGLQILRYNKTTAYIPHMDYIDDPRRQLKHNYDSAGKGGNRFATILLYMSDLGPKDGGETVFTGAWPVGQPEDERVPLDQALSDLRLSSEAGIVSRGSWEEEMVAQCRSRLAIRPNAARAVLFYSQHPNGEEDKSSIHGGCPVLSGEKWAANLWAWNTIRDGFPGAPVNEHIVAKEKKKQTNPTPQFEQKQASFTNEGTDPAVEQAELYFNDDTFWSAIGHGDPPVYVNTYEGHVWTLKSEGKIVRRWRIGKETDYQFVI